MYKLIYTAVFLLAALGASAQNMPERSEVRRGNRQYNKGNYEKSIERYERALEAAPESFESFFFFKQEAANEVRLSLVGPEMCIRARTAPA